MTTSSWATTAPNHATAATGDRSPSPSSWARSTSGSGRSPASTSSEGRGVTSRATRCPAGQFFAAARKRPPLTTIRESVREQKGRRWCAAVAESPAEGGANLSPASVPDIGRSLLHAREQAGLTLPEAAIQVRALATRRARSARERHVRPAARPHRDPPVAAGSTPTRSACPGATTSSSRSTCGRPVAPIRAGDGDTAVVPVVSISSAPTGGHSSAERLGAAAPTAPTGRPTPSPPA